VGAVLLEKCSECHGPDVRRPKGRFGFVDDLRRVAKKYVTPGDVDESELWWYLSGEQELMPPKKADKGPLSVDEFALIRWWILAGAPAPAAAMPGGAPREADEDTGTAIIASSHVVLVHFPIALAWAALLAELLVLMGRPRFATTARFCVVLAFLTAFATAFSGWSAGDSWSAERVDTHRWLGVGAFATLGLATILIPQAPKRAWARLLYRLFIFAGAGLVAAAGYLGGELIPGAGHLFG